MANQALVFGASGITGHPTLKQLLTYPTPTTFTSIIGLTNRPLSKDAAHLPNDERIQLHSGLDLTDKESTLKHLQDIPGIEKTTHVYFSAYAGHGSSYEELKRVNCEVLTNAVEACEKFCPEMKFFTLQTGGKAYGVEFVAEGCPYNPPLSESIPRVPEPWASKIFYYAQYDILKQASAGKSWTFCEIRPDAIVGFVPNNNAMNIAQAAGLFLALYREVNGEGAEVPFPGGKDAWTAPHTDTSQDILARFHIHASLNADKVSEKAFNVFDEVAKWEDVWPEICAYFDLKGTGSGSDFDAAKWTHDHSDNWEAVVQKQGLKEGALKGTSFEFFQIIASIPMRRDYDGSAARSVGFTESRKHSEGYKMAFDEMKKAKIIP